MPGSGGAPAGPASGPGPGGGGGPVSAGGSGAMPGVKSGPSGGSGPTGTVRAFGGAGGRGTGAPGMSGGICPGMAAAGTPGVKPGPFGFGGEVTSNESGHVHWVPAEAVRAEAIDTPVVGWRGKRVNTLRLWNAMALDPIRLDTVAIHDEHSQH